MFVCIWMHAITHLNSYALKNWNIIILKACHDKERSLTRSKRACMRINFCTFKRTIFACLKPSKPMCKRRLEQHA